MVGELTSGWRHKRLGLWEELLVKMSVVVAVFPPVVVLPAAHRRVVRQVHVAVVAVVARHCCLSWLTSSTRKRFRSSVEGNNLYRKVLGLDQIEFN